MENLKVNLPKDFKSEMKDILGDEYDEFEKSYECKRYAGLRQNPLKSDRNDFLGIMPFELSSVDWALEGFYYDPDSEHPGKSVYHEAGAYYIQEPSAMCAVSLLAPRPYDRVLDLCAAPGGKSTQIAGRLMNKGLLVSNEIVKDRAKILSQNIERMGVRNALVLNETPADLALRFPAFFDRILVDAPCSGEGMFKKEENAIPEWSLANVKVCHERQVSILDEAAKMLKPGGFLTYSTCTFNSLENEGTVDAFLSAHPEFTLLQKERLWPHKIKGEGHFAAKFVKAGELKGSFEEEKARDASEGSFGEEKARDASEGSFGSKGALREISVSSGKGKNNLKIKDKNFKGKDKNIKGKDANNKNGNSTEIKKFLSEEIGLNDDLISELTKSRSIVSFGDNIYSLAPGIMNLSGLKVERPGLHLATDFKNRLEPAHSLAMALTPSDVDRSFDMTAAEGEKYIKGETISCDPSLKGWVLMTVSGYSIGWGKASGGVIKNHYPKGLRKF